MGLRLVLGLALVVLGLRFVLPAQAFETAAKAAIILDSRTGVVLFEKDADERLPPASMSKLMTAYMIFDQLKGGRLKLDDEVLVSERAWKMGGSQMFVKVFIDDLAAENRDRAIRRYRKPGIELSRIRVHAGSDRRLTEYRE